MVFPRLPQTRPLTVLALVLGLVLAPAALADPPEPATGEVRTQVIELAEGWNFVALSVLPKERAIDAVLEEALSEVVLVKDEAGRHFIPTYGIRNIPEWRWDEAYMVRVERATRITVTGLAIDAAASSIELERGSNWVPYLGSESLPVEEAFASILSSVQQIQDEAGRTYAPGTASSTLATVEPGQGYNVRLNSDMVLVFPAAGSGDDGPGDEDGGSGGSGEDEGGDENGEGDGGSAADFPTLAAALAAVTSDDLGRTFTIGGYYADGDGGGGTFAVVEDGTLIPNGGTVFAPDAALGEPVEETHAYLTHTTIQLSRAPVNFGSLTMTLSATDAGGNPWNLAIPEVLMHGSAHQTANFWEPALNHRLGRFKERKAGGWPSSIYLSKQLGSGWSATATFEYTPIEGSLRLVRITTENGTPLESTTVWSPLWFGCRPHAASPYFDNGPCLNWTLLAAKHANEAAPGSVTEVRLPDIDGGGELYYYFRSITVPDGVTLSGAAGAEVVSDTDEFGNVFRPVRPRADAVVLKVLPEEAPGCEHCASVLNHILMRRDYSDPAHLPPDATSLLGNSWTQIQPEDGALTWGVRDLVLDGNEEGQQAIYGAPYVNNDRETYLRNAPGYTGIAQSNHGGKMTEGQRLTVERTYITGYSATGLITDIYADTTFLRDVGVGDAYYNHGAYLLSPVDAKNLSVHGKGWGHVEFYGGRVENLVLERMGTGRSTASAAFNFRGGDWSTCEAMREDGRTRPCSAIIDGFYADMRGGRRLPFAGIGPEIEIRNGIILDGPPELFVENGNGHQGARYEGFRMENVALYDTGEGAKDQLISTTTFNRGAFRNIRFEHLARSQTSMYGSVARMRSSNRGDDADAPYETVYARLGSAEQPILSHYLLDASYGSETKATRFFLLDSHHRIGSSTIIKGPSGQGKLHLVCGTTGPESCAKTDMLQLYIKDTEIQFPSDICKYGNCELFFEQARFDNLTDPTTGLASETTKTYTCQGGERSGYVESGLLWTPHPVRGEVSLSGALAAMVTSQEFQTTSGSALTDRNRANPRFAFTLAGPCSAGQQLTVSFKVARWLDENGQPVSVPDWYEHAP